MTTPRHSEDWSIDDLLAAKAQTGQRISVVIPARNEAATISGVVDAIRSQLVDDAPLIDELVVIDSLSDDATADVAQAVGAEVYSVTDIRPDLGVYAGKGEALWKSLFVTTGDCLVFIDADLVEWGIHFVTGLLGPMLTDPNVLIVKGFYDRVFDDKASSGPGEETVPQGGRVTELVARPLLSLRWPELTGVVQPLAGEWAIRRTHIERLSIPQGYGIEFSTLIDTYSAAGLTAIAQVDLGRRAHRHQTIHDLGVMAAEILAVADARSGLSRDTAPPLLRQPIRSEASGWIERVIPTHERPPQRDLA